ncbi:hypothetical protein [Amycolatopsis sp. NBC_00438]|uniref:hypothetical protein n=1 Tax=Amycolatopsis sp. NBC_00438 TaxID=2903558 RepID=UPI002E1B5B89
MTTYPENPGPPTVEGDRLASAEAHHDLSTDTWVGETPPEKMLRGAVVAVFLEENSHTGKRR